MKNGDIICEEHDTRLGDPDLIEAICEAHLISPEEWAALDESNQHAYQLAWVEPMPMFS